MSSRLFGAGALALSAVLLASAGDARPNRRLSSVPVIPPSHSVAFMGTLHDGRVATIYTDGRVMLAEPRGGTTASKRRRLELMRPGGKRPAMAMLNPARYGPLEGDISGAVRTQILFDLENPPQAYG